MKTAFIASLLVATSFAASAMSNNHQIWTYKDVAAGPGLTRAQVIAEMVAAKEAGQINLTEFDMRQAERQSQKPTSNLTRQQVQQEVVALRQQGLLDIQGDHR